MKKIEILFGAAFCALALASCQKELLEGAQAGIGTPVENVTFTASLPSTKVALEVDEKSGNLKGKWEMTDIIFGLKNDSEPIEFTVASIDEKGVATLALNTATTLSTGDVLHVIYCSGKTASDLKDGALAVDFSSQSLGNNPLVMTCDVTVSGNTVEFNFSNAVSIISIEDPDYSVNDDRAISKLVLSGHEIVSSAKVMLENGALTLKNDVPSNFITYNLSEEEYENDGSSVSFNNPIYIAVPPCKIERATFVDAKRYIKSYLIDKTAAASKYYKIAEKTFESIELPKSSEVKVGNATWATKNLGASSATSTGDLYQWSGTELIYSAKTTSAITAKPEFEGGFIQHTGYCYWDGVKYTKYTEASSTNPLLLDPVDDIVQLKYPGSGWRIPTLDDVTAFNNEITDGTISKAEDKDKKLWTFTKGNNSVGIRRVKDGAEGLEITQQYLYWTSTTTGITNAKSIQMGSKGTMGDTTKSRHLGLPIRPVRESASSAD